jgi:hypothetical protein
MGKHLLNMVLRSQASLIFAVLLLYAQGYGLAHGLDFDAHDQDETCELCLHLSVFNHAGVIAGPILVVAFNPSTLLATPSGCTIRATHAAAFQARGPPSPLPSRHFDC